MQNLICTARLSDLIAIVSSSESANSDGYRYSPKILQYYLAFCLLTTSKLFQISTNFFVSPMTWNRVSYAS